MITFIIELLYRNLKKIKNPKIYKINLMKMGKIKVENNIFKNY